MLNKNRGVFQEKVEHHGLMRHPYLLQATSCDPAKIEHAFYLHTRGEINVGIRAFEERKGHMQLGPELDGCLISIANEFPFESTYRPSLPTLR